MPTIRRLPRRGGRPCPPASDPPPPAPRVALLGSLLALAVALPGCGGGDRSPEAAAPAARRPNVLLLTLDTTRADRIGAYGKEFGATPRLDALAGKGVVFQYAYTATPLTIPAHATLLTGLLPPHHGVRDNGDLFLGEGAVTLAEVLKGAGYSTMASVGAYVTTRRWGFAQGFDAYFDDLDVEKKVKNNEWELERTGDRVVDDALPWLERNAGDKPFFSWLHFFDPHHPYSPPEEYAERFRGRPYAGEVAFMDAQIGRVLDLLEEKGVLEDTVVVAIGDHGEGLGEHDEPLHGIFLYDSTTRIPFIVKPAGGLPATRTIPQPVSGADLTPTVLGAVGLPVPEGLDGRDLSPWLRPEVPGALPEVPIYIESEYATRHYAWAGQRKIVHGAWKLHATRDPELYALDDVHEKEDRSDGMPGEVESLRRDLDALIARFGGIRSGISEKVEADSELGERLAALGYVATAAAVEPGAELPDPRQNIGVLRRLQESQAAMREERFDDAIRVLEQVLADAPELLDTRSVLAQAYMKAGQHARALPVVEEGIRRARKAGADNATLHTLRGFLLQRLQRRDEAIAELDIAVTMDPRQAQAWSVLVELFAEKGDMSRAKALAERALASGADSAQIRGVLGAAMAMEGQLDEAEKMLLSALEKRPDLQWAHYHLGTVALKRNEPEKAEERFLEEVRLYPDSPRPRMALASMYARVKAWDQQLEQLEAALPHQRPDADVWHALAQARFNATRIPEADQAIAECLKLDADHPACHMLRANVLARQGRREEGRRAADLANELARERGGTGKLR
ncbi:sulfatase-like hydrolase/transferase [Myxococcota bacterium]|nr:sulfatase-like hydrolase/transferase [Myxococcota bacterium]